MAWYVVTADFKTYTARNLTPAQVRAGSVGNLSIAAGPFPSKAAAQQWATAHTTRPAPTPTPRPGKPPRRAFTRAAIAAYALKFQGAGYVFGGPADVPGDWDCSSYASYVLGKGFGLLLPGGGKYGDPGYPPNSHGPVVLDYANWAGAVPIATPQAGDLCLWPGVGANAHMGIAIGPTRMISALNPQLGTMVTDIQGAGPSGVRVVFRRVTGLPGGVLRRPGGGVVKGPVSDRDPVVAVLVTAGLFAAAFAGLAVAAALVVLGGGWLMRKAMS